VSADAIAEQVIEVLRESGEMEKLAEVVGSGSIDPTAERVAENIAQQGISPLTILEESGEDIDLSHVKSVLNSHALWKAIDEMNEELEDESRAYGSDSENLVVRVASTTGVGVVAAFTAYALRGGALLASLISASPLWSVYDPLPVLRDPNEDKRKRFGKKKDNEPAPESPGAESIESMFGK
jgi:hypothetical protein